MRPVALTMPDDPAAVPPWLDRQLVGPHLAALIAELEAVHGPAADGPTANELLRGRRRRLCDEGIKALTSRQLRGLLRRPRLLLDVQRWVLAAGGPHWQQLLSTEPAWAAPTDRGWERLKGDLFAATPAPPPAPTVVRTRRLPAWVVSVATAAAVLLAVEGGRRLTPPTVPPPTGWGWAKGPPATTDRTAYLTALADAAGDWAKQRPTERAAVARRLLEFRLGCSALITADHTPLRQDDRDWLVNKCREWAATLDGYVRAVEAGDDPLAVRGKADETAAKIAAALRQRVTA